MVKRLCTIGWAFTGLIVAALVVQQKAYLHDKENAFGYACLHLLGAGWLGLMVSCVFAANMSACSNLMVNAGALFPATSTRNISTRPPATGRCCGRPACRAGSTLAGLGFALLIDQVLQAFLFTETIAALIGVIVVGGFLWRRANRFGAAAALAAAFLVYYGLNFLMTHPSPGEPAKNKTDSIGNALAQLQAACSHGRALAVPGTRKLLLVYNWMAAPYGWATLAGFAGLILVSLASHAEDPQRIERFFDNMRRTTDAQGLPDSQVKPLAAEHGQDLLLLDLPGWFTARRWRGFFRRYREDVLGFVLAWGVVALLVFSAWGLMQAGR